MRALRLGLTFALAALARGQSSSNGNLDQFNYLGTDLSLNNDYGPSDWKKVQCPSLNATTCLGWPDTYNYARGWSMTQNYCDWCPADGSGNCGQQHMSPIGLERDVAINGTEFANACIDVHFMRYHDSSCTFEILQEKNAFVIARHALKIQQPIKSVGNGQYALDCHRNGGGDWGRIDFSRGYQQWWFLSYAEFHVPSEHTQNGVRYDGEMHLYHFYSANVSTDGVDNQMGTVTFFLQVHEDAPDNDVLNRVICEWRRVEELNRERCQLPSITQEYPGCFFYGRGQNATSVQSQSLNYRRNLRTESEDGNFDQPLSAHDIIMHNMKADASDNPKQLIMTEEDLKNPEIDWDEFIKEVYRKDEQKQSQRHLMDYEHVAFNNYFGMLDVRTEYYFRYSGSQTVPPCYAEFSSSSNGRSGTNNWRVMKDPLRVSQRQINEMHRLLKDRIAPPDDLLRACKPDTAAAPDPGGDPNKIWNARPLQKTDKVHYTVFCECINWSSHWTEDIVWCQQPYTERIFDHPYNFYTNGF